MAYVTKPALLPSDFGFSNEVISSTKPVENSTKSKKTPAKKVAKKKTSVKKPALKKSATKKKPKNGRKLKWKV